MYMYVYDISSSLVPGPQSGDGKRRLATSKHRTCATSRSRSHGRKRSGAGYRCDGIERGHGSHHPHSTLHLCSKRTATTIHIQRCSHGESSHAGNSFATVVSYTPVHLYTYAPVTCIFVYPYTCIPLYLYTSIPLYL